jgi:integrase
MAGATLERPPARTPEVIPMSANESTASRGSAGPLCGSTVRELVDLYLGDEVVERRLAPRTLELQHQQLRDHLVPILGPETLARSVTGREIRGLVRALERRGLSGSAIRNCVVTTSSVFRFALRELEVVESNPVRELERGDLPSGRRLTEPRYLSLDEVGRLLDALTPAFRGVAASCFWAGLRVSEALSLRWSDVDFERGTLRVAGTKTSASRATLPLVDPLGEELKHHQRRERDAMRFSETGLVFQTRGRRTPGRRNVHRAVSRAAKKAGLVPPGANPVGVHDLRHSFAAFCLERGLSIVETSRLLRHADVAITARTYAGLSDSALTRLATTLNGLIETA